MRPALNLATVLSRAVCLDNGDGTVSGQGVFRGLRSTAVSPLQVELADAGRGAEYFHPKAMVLARRCPRRRRMWVADVEYLHAFRVEGVAMRSTKAEGGVVNAGHEKALCITPATFGAGSAKERRSPRCARSRSPWLDPEDPCVSKRAADQPPKDGSRQED